MLYFRENVRIMINLLEEIVTDDLEKLQSTIDKDEKVGYKTHIAMTPERIITAAVVTLGELHDGKQYKSRIKIKQDGVRGCINSFKKVIL